MGPTTATSKTCSGSGPRRLRQSARSCWYSNPLPAGENRPARIRNCERARLSRALTEGSMTVHTTRMLIVGSGPAGMAAAIYGARAGLKPIVVQGLQPGGQLTITTDVENYPGFRDVIQGPWLMEQMQAQAEHVGTRMLWDTIVSVDLSGPPFRAIGDGGDIYEGETLVIATGAQAKWLGVPGEVELAGKGVSACATCDGFFYRGKKVAV